MKNDLDQINKLAREYAEYANPPQVYADPCMKCEDRKLDMRDDSKNAIRFLEWLAKDYLVVEKSKVESAWLNSISDSLSDNYTTSQQGYTANKVIEYLFPETFNHEEK